MPVRATVLLTVLLALCGSRPALAQIPPWDPDAEWFSFESQAEPGTPALIRAVEGTENFTTVQVDIAGFYWWEKTDDEGNVYQQVFFPGLGLIGQAGAPQLPAVRMRLALPSIEGLVQLQVFEPLDEVLVEEIQNVYPQPVPQRDYQFGEFDLFDEDGEPEQFLIDAQIYASNDPWPTFDATPEAFEFPSGPINEVRLEAFPARFVPTTGEFLVYRSFRVTFSHPNIGGDRGPITLERERMARLRYLNWDFVRDFWPVNDVEFEADYLFVYDHGLSGNLQPLIDQKKARGYAVWELDLAEIGNTCEEIRAAIVNWYDGLPTNRDKYCLLVGDTDVLPQCLSPAEEWTSDVPTDDSYASTDGIDLDEEIYLGRLSIDDETDLDTQVAKLLQYMDQPLVFNDFRRVGLVAHGEDAPDKYVGAHESVRTASYANPPVFTTFYGNDAAVTDADVSEFIESGVGLVAYRGHGNLTAWTDWNTGSEYYTTLDVDFLANAPWNPVVWSFACTNAHLDYEDCIGEEWMETENGAVSHYGASVPSYTEPNHELDRAMFRAVYDYGLTKQSHAIETAETEMVDAHYPDNAWMYNLLGDPDMDIRSDEALPWTLEFPENVDPTCPSCPYTFSVLDESGQPVRNVLVSLFQSTNDFQTNRYTDASGTATLGLSGVVEGTVRVVFRSLGGQVFNETITVSSGATPAPSSSVSFRLTASPSLTGGATVFHFGASLPQEQTVRVFDVRGRVVRELRAEAGHTSLAWDGRDDEGRNVGSGLYLARTAVDGRVLSTRVTIVR